MSELNHIFGAQLSNNQVTPVRIESQVSGGYVGINLFGNISPTLQDSKERSRNAIESIGLKLPAKKISIAMSPADIKKDGNQYDLCLAIALASICKDSSLSLSYLNGSMLIGEVSLRGDVRSVKGIVSIILSAVKFKIKNIYISIENASEAVSLMRINEKLFSNLNIYCIEHISQLIGDKYEKKIISLKDDKSIYLKQLKKLNKIKINNFDDMYLSDLQKKWAVLIAAGRHHSLFHGLPGSGKSMFAKRIVSILPKLNGKTHLKAVKYHSLCGKKVAPELLAGSPMLRSPHHQASAAAILGQPYAPGELSLAHGGVLFLDELPEFRRDLLEAMREPIEEGRVYISRSGVQTEWDCKVLWISAANNCPCGWFGSKDILCRCPMSKIIAYQRRISGPLLDRIDLNLEMNSPKEGFMHSLMKGSHSPLATSQTQILFGRVEEALEFSQKRRKRLNIDFNGDLLAVDAFMESKMQAQDIENYSKDKLGGGWSNRSIAKLFKVARTLADMNQSQSVTKDHLEEIRQWKKNTECSSVY